MEHFESWKDLVNPEFYIKLGGFAESGLFFGFFLPGDSLLFISGIYSTTIISETFGETGSDLLNTTILAATVGIAAILGDSVGYWFGSKSGQKLYHKKESFFFKRSYLLKAQQFYEENGAIAIIIARFLPMIRTFAPIVAGMVKMDSKKFFLYNIIGGLLWSFSLIFAGHYLDKLFIDSYISKNIVN